MLNLLTVTYQQYYDSFNTPFIKTIVGLIGIIYIIILILQLLKLQRKNRITKIEGHSLAFFKAHENYRHQLLKRDIKALL